jgi:hypothetical protein
MTPDEILNEVGRRKQRAIETGIRETLLSLYFDSFQHYPTWFLNNNMDYIHPAITDARELDKGRIQITVDGKDYAFAYEEHYTTLPDGELYTSGKLSLSLNRELVLEFRVHVSSPENPWAETTRSPGDLEAFIEGPWVEVFNALGPRVKAHEKEVTAKREKEPREDPSRLDDLRRRFGIS